MDTHNHTGLFRWWSIMLFSALVCGTVFGRAPRPRWQRTEVNCNIPGGAKIKAVHYPHGQAPPMFESHRRAVRSHRKTVTAPSASELAADSLRNITEEAQSTPATTPVVATITDSPPLDGFIPWIAVAVTDAHSGELDLDALPLTSIAGNYLTSNPESDYIIAIFDTGAAAHVMGFISAYATGIIDADLLTSSESELIGVTGTASAWVSQPLGIFIDGLAAVEPNGLLLDRSAMVGEKNVSILVRQGDAGELEELTAIGMPLGVFYTVVIDNGRPITISYDGNNVTAPDIRFYESDDPRIPSYPNVIPVQLRPTGSVAVQYFPNILDPYDPEFGDPMSPSVLTGFLPSQSMFFASGVDLTHNGRSAIDKQGFMFDTGAQVSVISEAIAARLQLDFNNPDFEVEIIDVTGDVTIQPGFYIDLLEITATPQWLSYTNVPVVMLDIPSPEGGSLDGILGMNLFTQFNLVVRSGGLPDMGGHRIEFEIIPPCSIADMAPNGGDDFVNFIDLAFLADAWLATAQSARWNDQADIAPSPADGVIDFEDLSFLAQYWLHTCP